MAGDLRMGAMGDAVGKPSDLRSWSSRSWYVWSSWCDADADADAEEEEEVVVVVVVVEEEEEEEEVAEEEEEPMMTASSSGSFSSFFSSSFDLRRPEAIHWPSQRRNKTKEKRRLGPDITTLPCRARFAPI